MKAPMTSASRAGPHGPSPLHGETKRGEDRDQRALAARPERLSDREPDRVRTLTAVVLRLVAVAVVALIRPTLAGWALLLLGVGALVLVIALYVAFAVAGHSDTIDLESIPFTFFAFTLPATLTSLLLRIPRWMSN